MPVDIVSLDYDFWYELGKADDQLEPGEVPQRMNENGVLYYCRFRRAGENTTPTWPDSAGYPDIERAMLAAQEQSPSPITWT
jgi:hypothetical protein